MIFKTNHAPMVEVCKKMGVNCELLENSETQNVHSTPFIYMEGDAVKSMVELANSAKGRMLMNLIGVR